MKLRHILAQAREKLAVARLKVKRVNRLELGVNR